MKILALISDHGFGHASRSTIILNELLQKNVKVHICSSVPIWYFQHELENFDNSNYTECKMDVGLVQISGVQADYGKTITELEVFWQNLPQKVENLYQKFKNEKFDAIFFDIPALAPLLAEKLKIPSIGMGNFSWDVIYNELTKKSVKYSTEEILEKYHNKFAEFSYKNIIAYQKTSYLFMLPFSTEFPAFNCTKESINWFGKESQINKKTVRKKLELSATKKIVLLSFGGNNFPKIEFIKWKIPENWEILVIGHKIKNALNIRQLTNIDIIERGMNYIDVINAVDLIITKPGYGIICDCIFTQKPILHISRGRFAEYPFLIKAMNKNINNKKVATSTIINGTFFQNAEKLLNLPQKRATIKCNGKTQIVNKILEIIKQTKSLE